MLGGSIALIRTNARRQVDFFFGGLMNCTCIDLHGKCLYDTWIISKKELVLEGVEVRLSVMEIRGNRRCCAGFVRRQIVRSRLGIDEMGDRVTEPQKLEINCVGHAASHYSEAAWPGSTLSQSISYYNHANCGQIRDLTYWYYIPVQPPLLLGAGSNMHCALFSVKAREKENTAADCVCVGVLGAQTFLWRPQIGNRVKFLCAKLMCHFFLSFYLTTLFFFMWLHPLSASLARCAERQPARSFAHCDSVDASSGPAGQRADDVIWAKGCVNTAVTLVSDLSIGLGLRTEERIVWDWEQRALAMIAASLQLTDWYDNLRYVSLTSDPSCTYLTIFPHSPLSLSTSLSSPLLLSFLFDIVVLAVSRTLIIAHSHVLSPSILHSNPVPFSFF